MANQSLTALQKGFQAYLLGDNQNILTDLKSSPHFNKEKGIQLYQDAYLSRLESALKADFPILALALGKKTFKQVATEYAILKPSEKISIRHFSDDFPSFLESLNNKYANFYQELALFERALSDAFDAKDENLLSISLSDIPKAQWSNLKVHFHPSVRLLKFHWNCPNYWQRCHQKKKVIKRKYQRPAHYVVWRKEYETYFIKLSQVEQFILKSLMNETSFIFICKGLNQWLSKSQCFITMANRLQTWIGQGVITKFSEIKV